MSPNLEFISGPKRGQSFVLKDREAIVGRDVSCQVSLNTNKISRQHARIVREKEEYFVEDLNSTNGTFVNGERLRDRRKLRHQDQIQFHDIIAVFRIPSNADMSSVDRGVQSALPITADIDGPSLPEILNAVNAGSDSRINVNAHEKLRAVLEMTRRLGSSLDVDQMLRNMLDGLFAVFPQTDRGYVLFPEGMDKTLVMRAQKDKGDAGQQALGPVNFELAERALTSNQAILARDEGFAETDSVLDTSLRSMICIPLVGPLRKELGVVYLETNDFTERFLEEDLRALICITRIVGQAIEYAYEHESMVRMQRQHTAELERSNGELQQFAYAASHDLQEPLRAVAGYCQLLQTHYKGKLDEQGEEFIGRAVSATKRMQTLITGLLDYARVSTRAQDFSPTDSNKILTQALINLEVALQETDAKVTGDSLPMIRVDARQFVQLFQNIIGNAIKYRNPSEAPRVHVSAVAKGNEWEFSIRDNGIGIDPKHANRIFEVFQRLHSQDEYPGAGIGLAICKKVVERHGGKLRVESSPGKGSTFLFTVPQG